MGKGLSGFMSKKAFHPGSYANQKRIQEAEAKAEAKRKHDEETLAQYKKEQELFHQKSLISRESKEKLSLNFMYEAPPGAEKPDEKKSDKLEWKANSNSKASASGSGSVPSHLSHVTNTKSESTICLEWKRDKLVKGSAQEVRQSSLKVKPKVEEIKKEKFKEEPDTDLKYGLNERKSKQPPSLHIQYDELDKFSTNIKKLKKER